MPLYEYECNACAHRFERIQKFSDPLVSACPVCNGEVRKLLSSPAIQFKGTGWYVTDYAKKKPGGAESDAKGGADGAAKKDGAGKSADSKKDAGGTGESSSAKTSKADSAASGAKPASGGAASR